MSWEQMLDAEARCLSSALNRDEWYAQHGYPGSTGKWIKASWDAGRDWVVSSLVAFPWGELSEVVAINELRKGAKSIYYPQFREDPRIVADCPKDGPVTVGVEGYCDACGFPFDGMPRIREDEK